MQVQRLRNLQLGIWLTLALVLLNACRPTPTEQQIRVTVIADGRERTFIITSPTTVEEFLRNPKVDIQLGDLDRINPQPFTQITDGIEIRIARVSEQNECIQSEIPFKQTSALNEGLQPGEQRVVQAGQNGILEICYRVTIVDGTPTDRVEIGRTEIRAAQDEIIYTGPTGSIEPVPITGTLAYVSNGNIWLMQGSSTTKRPITTEGDVDRRVFTIAPDGRKLLFARKLTVDSSSAFGNQLYLIADVSQATEPVALVPNNVLYAEWIPGQDNTITYSTAEPRDANPGWLAYNDLQQMRIDPTTGSALSFKQILDRSASGLYSWWGTRFHWSSDGKALAWVQADGAGLVDLENGKLGDPLVSYPVLRPVGDWSWRATVSWSPDNDLILTTVHGAPVGSESPVNSPVFNIAAVNTQGLFSASLVENAGIWAAPQFSPFVGNQTNQFPSGYIAYLKSRDAFNSINGEYDLVVSDRDGSNERMIFPGADRPGIRAQQTIFINQEFTWSPDGTQIALIYQGNLWVVDVESQISHQLTLDQGASNPVWVR